MTTPHGDFIWYELITPDPDAAKSFYDAVVGWDIGPQASDTMDYRMIAIPGGGNAGGVLRLTDEMQSHGARPVWLGYLGVDDVDAMVASAEHAGGKALMPAQNMPGIGRVAMIADPQGAPSYIMKPTPLPGNEDATSNVFSVDEPGHVLWNELATSDPEAAITFYKRHFGWHQEGDMDMGEYGTYRFLQHGGVGIGTVMPKLPQMPVSIWTYYFGVDDIDRAAKAVTDGGGTILMGPMEIPGREFSLNAMDPQQASFGLVGPRTS